MTASLRASQLEAYLDEALPAREMARIEHLLRASPDCAAQLAEIVARRDAGVHTLGEIWRRHRLACPTRGQLAGYMSGTVPEDEAAWIAVHLNVVGCRACLANLSDLKDRQGETSAAAQIRRRRFFQSSAGHLKRE